MDNISLDEIKDKLDFFYKMYDIIIGKTTGFVITVFPLELIRKIKAL